MACVASPVCFHSKCLFCMSCFRLSFSVVRQLSYQFLWCAAFFDCFLGASPRTRRLSSYRYYGVTVFANQTYFTCCLSLVSYGWRRLWAVFSLRMSRFVVIWRKIFLWLYDLFPGRRLPPLAFLIACIIFLTMYLTLWEILSGFTTCCLYSWTLVYILFCYIFLARYMLFGVATSCLALDFIRW